LRLKKAKKAGACRRKHARTKLEANKKITAFLEEKTAGLLAMQSALAALIATQKNK
jgi:ribosomal protein S12